SRPSESEARSQHARLRQRRHASGLPHSGAEHAAHRDRARAERRPDVRDRRPDEQQHHVDALEDSGHRRHSDSRPAVQEQGGAEEPDRARRDDHAADSAAHLAWCDAEPAAPAGAVSAADAAEPDVRAAASGVHAGSRQRVRGGARAAERVGTSAPAYAPNAATAAAAVSALTPSSAAPRVQTPGQPQAQPPAPAQTGAPGQQPLAARPVSGTPASSVERPLTPDEQQRIDRARAMENANRVAGGKEPRKSDEKADKEALKAQQRQDEINHNAAKAAKERDEKIAKEKAKLEKEKAKRDAEKAKADAAAAKRQAEIDRSHQKALEEAAAKAKEAQAKYDALAKSQK